MTKELLDQELIFNKQQHKKNNINKDSNHTISNKHNKCGILQDRVHIIYNQLFKQILCLKNLPNLRMLSLQRMGYKGGSSLAINY